MDGKVVGIIAHDGKPGAKELAEYFVERFRGAGWKLLADQPTAALAGLGQGTELNEVGERAAALLVLGGDGTLLRVVHSLPGRIPPLVGINLGSLGFLTCVGEADKERAVQAILEGKLEISWRSLLDVTVWRGDERVSVSWGLNEAVISRGQHSHLVKLDVAIDGQPLSRYNADGLIVATATGSTAYSLSAGGPILNPDVGGLVITPICPHVLTNRSLIVRDAACFSVKVWEGDPEVLLTVDGRYATCLRGGDEVRISKSDRSVPIAMLPGGTFFDLLRQKLKWSGTNV